MKKTYRSPLVNSVLVEAGYLLSGSLHSNDANKVIDDLKFDREGENKVSESNEVW